MTRYPTLEEAVAVHAKLIGRFGGSVGIRDAAALESALARRRSVYYSDLIQEAAALSASLSQNGSQMTDNALQPLMKMNSVGLGCVGARGLWAGFRRPKGWTPI